jgi:hypothetical protein
VSAQAGSITLSERSSILPEETWAEKGEAQMQDEHSMHTDSGNPLDANREHILVEKREAVAPSFACFEDWLTPQEEEQDDLGNVARFVLADIAKGCWPHSELGSPRDRRTYKNLGDEFEDHLIRVHAFPRSLTQTFRLVYEEYRQEHNLTVSADLQAQVSEVLLYTTYRWEDKLRDPARGEPVALNAIRQLRRMISDYTHGDSTALSGTTHCVVEQLRLPRRYEEVLAPIVAKEIQSLESLGWHGLLPF